MSRQSIRPLIDALRAPLSKAEADLDPETPALANLKNLLRQRVAELESTARLVGAR